MVHLFLSHGLRNGRGVRIETDRARFDGDGFRNGARLQIKIRAGLLSDYQTHILQNGLLKSLSFYSDLVRPRLQKGNCVVSRGAGLGLITDAGCDVGYGDGRTSDHCAGIIQNRSQDCSCSASLTQERGT